MAGPRREFCLHLRFAVVEMASHGTARQRAEEMLYSWFVSPCENYRTVISHETKCYVPNDVLQPNTKNYMLNALYTSGSLPRS